jgi:imidazole glycerol-phosphate synthase subunit HisH
MIAVVDIGLGNIRSVTKVLDSLCYEYKVVNNNDSLSNASKIIFPGVGNFFKASELLALSGLSDVIRKKIHEGTPYLGICLGMQLLADSGEEGGQSDGLGIISGTVIPMARKKGLRIPHMGWNSVNFEKSKLVRTARTDFYFVHSYCFDVHDSDVKIHYCDYGDTSFVAAIEKNNVFGVQFHPEKSQKAGLKLIEKFMKLC